MGPATLFQMSVMHERCWRIRVHQHHHLRHHRVTGCWGQRRHGAPALTYPICLGLKDRIGACSLCLYPARCDGHGGHNKSSCSEALRGRPNRVVAMCDGAPLQSIACACTLRGIVGSQDLHDGGFSCHVPPAPGPSAKPASPLSIRSTEKLSDLSLWTVIAPSRLHLLPVVCRTSHVFALCPPGTTDAHALHPHIRSRSHGVRS